MKPNIRIIFVMILFIALIDLAIPGCSKTDIRQSADKISNETKNIEHKLEASSDGNNKSEKGEVDWKALMAEFNPPNIKGLISAVNASKSGAGGSVNITPEIRKEFNKMGNHYKFFFMPEVSWYDFKATAYEPFGEALSYIMFMCMSDSGGETKVPQYEAEAMLRKIFAVQDGKYPLLKHKSYPKCVNFDGEYYTPWPESYNSSTKVYDLTELKAHKDGEYTYYTASLNEYQFDLQGIYEPTENEIYLSKQAQELGLNSGETLDKLLVNGNISTAPLSRSYTVQFRVKNGSIIPQIVKMNKV